MTVGEWLVVAKTHVSALDAELIAAHVFGETRARVLAHPEWTIDTSSADKLVTRRIDGEPMAYIRGRQEFYGREFLVTPDVLIPRPETEVLVDEVLREVREGVVLDIGTGSGAIAITLALENQHLKVVGSDISPAALEVSAKNAKALGANVLLVLSDGLNAFRGAADAIVSNPPYVAPGDPNLEQAVANWEPGLALYAEGGSGFIARLVEDGELRLRPGGLLAFEFGVGQSDVVQDLLAEWDGVKLVPDLAGIPRVALARRSCLN